MKNIREKLTREKLQGVATTPLGCIRVNAPAEKQDFACINTRVYRPAPGIPRL